MVVDLPCFHLPHQSLLTLGKFSTGPYSSNSHIDIDQWVADCSEVWEEGNIACLVFYPPAALMREPGESCFVPSPSSMKPIDLSSYYSRRAPGINFSRVKRDCCRGEGKESPTFLAQSDYWIQHPTVGYNQSADTWHKLPTEQITLNEEARPHTERGPVVKMNGLDQYVIWNNHSISMKEQHHEMECHDVCERIS